jgi:UDP-N-acetylmuramoyl-tripeptide--D-alanyl-D-alanine ligase
MQWKVEQAARALGLAAPSGISPVARLAGVSIDSRAVRPNELFIAIRGPRFDGHAFVEQALGAGALAAVVQRAAYGDFLPEIRSRMFPVDDTLAALQQLARAVLHEWRAASPGRRVAAITGSAGKTTAKEILAALLGSRVRVLKSEGNLNNEYGLPLTLLRLEDADDVVVAELGMSRRGELARLAALAEPQIGVVTCVAPVHLEYFSSVDEIALAKRELVDGLAGPAPVAVLNADDSRVARFAEGFRGRTITFGINADADFRAENIEDRGMQGSNWDCVSSAGRTRLSQALPGRHSIYNALAALAAASQWDILPVDAASVLRSIRPASMRGELIHFAPGFTVVNDAYNSNPAALSLAVEAITATPGYRRRLIVAGEMRELGSTSVELHRQCGREMARVGNVDWIFAVSGDAAEILEGAIAAGFPQHQTRFFESSLQAAEFLTEFLKAGDLLLVKGSRSVRMEAIVEALLTAYPHPLQAAVTGGEPGRAQPPRLETS